jgi:hypothetical protein
MWSVKYLPKGTFSTSISCNLDLRTGVVLISSAATISNPIFGKGSKKAA